MFSSNTIYLCTVRCCAQVNLAIRLFAVFLFVVCSYAGAFSQEKEVSGLVLNMQGKPIEFASIYNEQLGIGTYTDSLGRFKIFVSDHAAKLHISALGFENKQVDLTSELMGIEIHMNPIEYDLLEVQVTPHRFKKKVVKVSSGNKVVGELRACSGYSYQCGLLISPNVDGILERISISLENEMIDTALLRLRLYEVDASGKPGKDILKENLLLFCEKSKKKFDVQLDMKPFQITLPKGGIVVAIEWMKVPTNRYAHKITVNGRIIERACFGPVLNLTRSTDESMVMWSKQDGGDWFPNSFRTNTHARRNSTKGLIPLISIDILEFE
jgi:hypothetical protein